ncbi:MAG: amino acid adenylation domain-containing protein, partial [Cyanobacteria bacterium J06558_2]
ISFTARIDSVVDITAMIKAFTTLMERHPILRTNYFQLGAEPIQQVNDFQELNFEQVDAAIWSNEQLKEQVVESHQQPFDLKQGSVLRVRWFTRSESEHVLLLTIHHIACDARSRDLLLEELLQLYQTQQAQVAPSLAPVEYSYQDYVYWQKNILENSSGEKLKDYWQNQLAGDLPVLNLATDKPRPPIQTYNGASHKFDISAQLLSKLKVITRREGVTFYMLMLAAFQVLLSRYTEQKDLLVGSPTSGRTQPELASIVGYFVDPVVIRSDLSDNQSFLDFLRQVRQTVLEAITHQDYPFTLLVNKLQPQRDPSRSPIFQAFFNLQKPPLLETFFDLGESQPAKKTQTASEQRTRTLDWGGLKLRPFEIPQLEGQFDLSLEIFEGNSFKGDFRYNADLFNASTIERMATHFQNLLSAIAENPAENITSLDLMSDSERHQLLVEWNDTQTEYPQDQCLHQLFEAQVEQTPGDIAVIFEGQQLTYQELNAQANQLARYLQHQGVQPETLVGICVERSLEMIVGLLAILKTGGAYLPLDPAYPQERLVFILSDSEVSLLLTQSHLADHQGSHSVKTVCLDLDNQKFSQYSTENLFSSATPENLAYVIYTSGSTGKPKGVPIPHRGVVNFLTSMGQTPGLGKEDILLSVTTLSFDIAGLEIYLPLTVGARLVLVSQEAIADSTQLAQRLAFHQVTVMQATPATWKMLLKAGWQNNSNIKILCGGEALDANLAAQLTEGGQEVWNLYGPTETTIWSAALEVNLEAEHQGHVSVGAPIANTQLYILDSALQSVPVGVPGELHIGGTGLGRGYWKRPDLTAAKFIPNPFSELGERLYKTGDLARYQADGKIEFLGRIDHQVKIRGFRIELGEIEVLLKEHLQVEEAVVLAREDLTRDSRLVAYLVTKNQVELSVNELREFLKAKVPDYMLPSTFVMLNQLPLTPNGKIDKKSLPIPESKRPTLAANYQAPQSETEEKIAQIWREVLHLDKVGIHDNFFDLGGHSLLLLELQQKLNQSLQKDFSVVLMFQYPTIAALAEFMRQDNSEEDAFKSLSDRVRKQKEIRQKQLLKKSRHPAR